MIGKFDSVPPSTNVAYKSLNVVSQNPVNKASGPIMAHSSVMHVFKEATHGLLADHILSETYALDQLLHAPCINNGDW